MKKIIPILFIATAITASCSNINNDDRVKICGNVGTYLYMDDNRYLAPDILDISSSIKIGASFGIYFTNSGCSSCQEFSPIMYHYMESSMMMIYKFDLNENEREIDEFKEAYGEIFFKKDENKEYIVPTPGFCLYFNHEAHYVDYTKYMHTEGAFNNYMKANYKVSNVYYTHGDVFKTDFVDCEFSYVYFDFDQDSLMDIYKTKVARHVQNSNRTVIVSHYFEDSLIHLKLCGKNGDVPYSRKEFVVTRDTGDNVINEVL